MKKTNSYGFFFVFILLALLHYCILNGLEKMLFLTNVNSNLLRRPIPECKHLHNLPNWCLGMPSGHTELATILGGFLYSTKRISFLLWMILIAVTCLQRVLSHRHTFLQTIIGVLFGFFYTCLYLSLSAKIGYPTILCCLFFILLYSNLLVLNLDSLVYEKIPDWVDKQMLPNIEKKRNVPYYFKLMSVLTPSCRQNMTLFMTWSDLEMYLDKMVENIKQTGVSFDAVIGIKTGGAVISDYVSNQLNLPNYKIKVSRKKYNCKKTPKDFVSNFIDVYLTEEDREYMVCEGIQDDLKGKNVIVIDECIVSGTTLNASIDYLISKEVNTVYPTAIVSCYKAANHPVFPFTSIYRSHGAHVTWPWGYDN